MKTKETGLSALWLSYPLAALVAVAAGAGLFWPPAYAQETPVWAAEGTGGAAVNLVLIVPILLVSARLAQRGSVGGRVRGYLLTSNSCPPSSAFFIHNSEFIIAFPPQRVYTNGW